MNGVFIFDCSRDKKLKNTQSWTTNLLIKIHFAMKAAGVEYAAGNPKETIAKLKELDIFKCDENL